MVPVGKFREDSRDQGYVNRRGRRSGFRSPSFVESAGNSVFSMSQLI